MSGDVVPVINRDQMSLHNTHKKRKGSLETRAKPVVLWAYVEKQVMLEPTLPYRALKCKQTKSRGVGLFMDLLFDLFVR